MSEKPDLYRLIRPCVREIKPYVPGKPIEEVERELGIRNAVKLASNENCLGTSPLALEAAQRALAQGFHLYPDGASFYLRRRLAEVHGVAFEQTFAGSGTTEVIQLLAMAMLEPDGEAVYGQQSFVMYPLAVRAVGAVGRAVPLDHAERHDLEAMAAAVTPRTRLVFIANPNNPTGTYVTRSALESFLARLPDHVVVALDEAYFEYVGEGDYPNGLDYVHQGRNLVVLRTFSKVHGLAGMRVGYAIGPEPVIDALHRIRSPFNVTSLGQVMALAALDDQAHVARSREHNRREIGFLSSELGRRGVPYTPSVANFVLVDVARKAEDAFSALLRQGVIARPMTGSGFPTRLRVSVGTREENERFLAALDRLLGR